MKKIWIIILFSFSFCAINAQGKQAVFGEGEKLTFVVSYKAALVPNTEVAEVVLTTRSSNLEGTPVYYIKGNARIFSFFRWFYDLDDNYESWLRKSDLKPVKYLNNSRENKTRRRTEFIYDWNGMRIKTNYQNLTKGTSRSENMQLKQSSYDAVALFYNLRCENLDGFTVGTPRYLDMVLDDTIRRISYRLVAREKKNIKGLGTFNTLKFACRIATSTGENFKDGSKFYLWVSDDQNRIPLYIESPIRVGSVRGKLTKYENLKYDLSSKLK